MIGSMSAQRGVLRGSVKRVVTIVGTMRAPIGVVPIDNYEGSYEILPTVEVQTMDTAGKRMTDDVQILAIPLYEVSNECGCTLIIGG